MRHGYPGPNQQAMWQQREAVINDIVLGQEPACITDFTWQLVLPPPGWGYAHPWPYPAITAAMHPNMQDYSVLITKSVALLGHPSELSICGFDNIEAHLIGLDTQASPPSPHPDKPAIEQRLAGAHERGAYVRFYVTSEGRLTTTAPDPETYAGIPIESEAALTLRALAYWPRTRTNLTIPAQGNNRLVSPAGDLKPILPY